jgi:hypothetical protein
MQLTLFKENQTPPPSATPPRSDSIPRSPQRTPTRQFQIMNNRKSSASSSISAFSSDDFLPLNSSSSRSPFTQERAAKKPKKENLKQEVQQLIAKKSAKKQKKATKSYVSFREGILSDGYLFQNFEDSDEDMASSQTSSVLVNKKKNANKFDDIFGNSYS